MKKYIEFFKKNYDGNNIDFILSEIRKIGASQMESTMLLCKQLKLKVGDADKIVNNSETWKDKKQGNDKFRSEFEDFMDSIE